jgi:hypothetical protein
MVYRDVWPITRLVVGSTRRQLEGLIPADGADLTRNKVAITGRVSISREVSNLRVLFNYAPPPRG